jgi:DtxR family Mn-dependent transcriptional regulator
VENYLEVLYRLHLEEEPIKTTAIARELGLTPASVTEMLQRLAEDGYLEYKRYKGVRMTPKGVSVATDVLRRRKLLIVFLHDVLGMDMEEAEREAHHLEHTISEEVEERLCALLGNPQKVPGDDDMIPLCPRAPDACSDCQLQSLIPMTAMATGHRGVVRAVLDDDIGTMSLARIGLEVGSEFQILSSSGEDVKISIGGKRAKVGWDVAQRLVVKRIH